MPRKPDPHLEQAIVDAAVRLLDAHGIEAVTMREVAKAAGTTTPTLYERFRDRQALLEAVTDKYRDELAELLHEDDSLEQMGAKFLRFCCENPNAIDLLVNRVAANIKGKTKGPVYEMVRTNLIRLDGFSSKDAEEMTLATSSTMAGAAVLINRVGADSHAATQVERATVKLLRRVAATGTKRQR
ncbi:MAG: TetR/AcrR family transcriptional regulator [Terriglobales bacterium]